jgi:UDP-glucuronate 4-epimerase
MKILVTGGAGFVGYHLINALLSRGDQVVNIDNLNSYYNPQLKRDRMADLAKHHNAVQHQFVQMDIADRQATADLFNVHCFDAVVNLAAQAGVRYSIQNPHAYVDSNLVGFVNILEGCRRSGVKHLVYASSSSVYGMNTKQPFSTADRVDHPISLYAATKKSNELMAHTYSHLYNLPTTGLRFFTVYGPWGRPDMAYYSFTKKILAGQPIDVFNSGHMQRDFTYIDDIVTGLLSVIDLIPQSQANTSTNAQAPYKLYNIGNNQPVSLRRFITAIEAATGKKAVKNHLPMQAGDVPITYADVDELIRDIGFKPSTSIEEGINRFVTWYTCYLAKSLTEKRI